MFVLILSPLLTAMKAFTGPTSCVDIQRVKTSGECSIITSCSVENAVSLNTHDFSFLCVNPRDKNQVTPEAASGIRQDSKLWKALDWKNYPADLFVTRHLYSPCMGKDSLNATAGNASSFAPPCFSPKGEFFTGQHCAQCLPDVENPDVRVLYGPKNCLSAYRSSRENTCYIDSNCEAGDLDNINVGLTCVKEDGSLSMHVFGKNSFDAVETYNTMIPCAMCLGVSDEVGNGSFVNENTTSEATSNATVSNATKSNTTTALLRGVVRQEKALIDEVLTLKEQVKSLSGRIEVIEHSKQSSQTNREIKHHQSHSTADKTSGDDGAITVLSRDLKDGKKLTLEDIYGNGPPPGWEGSSDYY